MGLRRSVRVPVLTIVAAALLVASGGAAQGAPGPQTEEPGKATVKLVRTSGGVRLVVKLGPSAADSPRRVVVAVGKQIYPLTPIGGDKKPSSKWRSANQKGAEKARLEQQIGKAVKVTVIERDGSRHVIAAVLKGLKTTPPSAPARVTPPEVAPQSGPPVAPGPPFGTLSATLSLPGPLLSAPKEMLRFKVKADADSVGEAFIALPDAQADPTFGTPVPFGSDFTPSPQVSNSGLPGYAFVGSSNCANATLREVIPVKEVLPPGAPKPGIRVAYDCTAGQEFSVFYNPRISYWEFGSFPNLDTWKFNLSRRRAADQPWSPLPIDLKLQVGPTYIELNQNILINPPAPVVASEAIANGQVKLITQGYNAAGIKNESTFESRQIFSGNGEIIEVKNAENLRTVEQTPIEVNGCIWATEPGSQLNVTGDDATDTIHTTNLLQNGDVVIFTAKTGGSTVKQGAKYYVINRTPSSFQISADGKAAANLGSDITSPSAVVRQTVTPPPNAPPLICEDIYVFGVIETHAPPDTFSGFANGAEWIGVTFAQSSTHTWIGASRECLAAGGTYTDVDGPTPGKSGTADWRCDFPASKGYTHDVLKEILHGWANEYGKQETCGYRYLFLEENYSGGGGADDIWCPLVTT